MAIVRSFERAVDNVCTRNARRHEWRWPFVQNYKERKTFMKLCQFGLLLLPILPQIMLHILKQLLVCTDSNCFDQQMAPRKV